MNNVSRQLFYGDFFKVQLSLNGNWAAMLWSAVACATCVGLGSYPAGKCTYNVRTLYVQARTYGFGTDNIRNESFLDVRVRTYNVRT